MTPSWRWLGTTSSPRWSHVATSQERKLRDYRLYRRFNEYVSGGGIREGDRGEHGWSKMTVPLVFWVVETVLSRMGVEPPKVTVSARTPEAGPFAQAAQLGWTGTEVFVG
jgi:hypothetical protein